MIAILNLGGGEIILLLGVFVIFVLASAAVFAAIFFAVRAFQKKPPPDPAKHLDDVNAQLRTLAKLKEDGVITEQDFEAKKRVILGI